VFVKICGITTEEDGLFAAAMGADAVGFVFAPSTRRVTTQQARDIVRRLPPEVLTVGVFRDELPERVIAVCHEAGLRCAQLHGHETPAMTQQVRRGVGMVIQAFAAGSDAFARAGDHGADIVLVDAPQPGSGTVFDWSLVEGAPVGGRLLLAGGLTADNVAAAIRRVRPWGVDVSSGVERSAGRKDPVKVKRFIDAARSADVGDDAHPVEHAGSGPVPFDWQEDA
jgi:phosphoribosylanthranilate isomerase